MSFINSWGLFPWFPEHGTDHVHPDDLVAMQTLGPYGKLFVCEQESDYLSLRHRDVTYRVRPTLFCPVSAPSFGFFEHVISVSTNEEATIDSIEWHHKQAEPIFYLAIKQKRKSKRYLTSELRST